MTRLLSIITIFVLALLTTGSLIQKPDQLAKKYLRARPEVEGEIRRDLEARKYSLVIEKTDKEVKDHPNSAPIIGMRAIAYVVKGEFEKAKTDADIALHLEPGRFCGWTYIARGLLDLARANPKNALAEFDCAVQLKADCPLVYEKIAECKMLLNELKSVEDSLDKSFNMEKNNCGAKVVKAEYMLTKQKPEVALVLSKQVLKESKNNLHARLIELISLAKLGDNEELKVKANGLMQLAEKELNKQKKLDSKWNLYHLALAHTAYAYSCFYLNKNESALDSFKISLDLMPDQALGVEGLARLYIAEDKVKAAQSLFKQHKILDSQENLSWLDLKKQIELKEKVEIKR